jgi:hypothetical protein
MISYNPCLPRTNHAAQSRLPESFVLAYFGTADATERIPPLGKHMIFSILMEGFALSKPVPERSKQKTLIYTSTNADSAN